MGDLFLTPDGVQHLSSFPLSIYLFSGEGLTGPPCPLWPSDDCFLPDELLNSSCLYFPFKPLLGVYRTEGQAGGAVCVPFLLKLTHPT